MQIKDNKFLLALVISNIIAFIIIFLLIWKMWGQHTDLPAPEAMTAHEPDPIPRQTEVTEKAIKEVKTVTDKEKKLSSAVMTEVQKNLATLESLAKIDDTTEPPDTQPSVTGAISDKDYIRAYRTLGQQPAKAKPVISEKDATTVRVKDDDATTAKSANRNFNKVDLSKVDANQRPAKTLAQRVEALVSEEAVDSTEKSGEKPAWKDYLSALKEAEAERQNEMRTITVKRGETLWRISIRAYGTGFKYKKIFEANPHLTSPHQITTGEILRVPL